MSKDKELFGLPIYYSNLADPNAPLPVTAQSLCEDAHYKTIDDLDLLVMAGRLTTEEAEAAREQRRQNPPIPPMRFAVVKP